MPHRGLQCSCFKRRIYSRYPQWKLSITFSTGGRNNVCRAAHPPSKELAPILDRGWDASHSYSRRLRSSEGTFLSFLFTHHQNRAVSMPDNRVGDASHEGSPYPTQASAPYHYQASVYLVGQVDDLLRGPT